MRSFAIAQDDTVGNVTSKLLHHNIPTYLTPLIPVMQRIYLLKMGKLKRLGVDMVYIEMDSTKKELKEYISAVRNDVFRL